MRASWAGRGAAHFVFRANFRAAREVTAAHLSDQTLDGTFPGRARETPEHRLEKAKPFSCDHAASEDVRMGLAFRPTRTFSGGRSRIASAPRALERVETADRQFRPMRASRLEAESARHWKGGDTKALVQPLLSASPPSR